MAALHCLCPLLGKKKADRVLHLPPLFNKGDTLLLSRGLLLRKQNLQSAHQIGNGGNNRKENVPRTLLTVDKINQN